MRVRVRMPCSDASFGCACRELPHRMRRCPAHLAHPIHPPYAAESRCANCGEQNTAHAVPSPQNHASRACSRFQTKLRPCRKRAKTRREIVPNKIKATPQAEPKLHRQNHADRKVTAGQKVTADKPDALACIRQAHLKAPSRPPLPRQGRAQDSFRTPLLSHPGFHPRTRL